MIMCFSLKTVYCPWEYKFSCVNISTPIKDSVDDDGVSAIRRL